MKISSLSLGIPVYNQVSTIEEAIISALSQIEPFDEIVVSDNHSTDGTSEILAKYINRIKIIKPEVHLGMAQNWNFCVGNLNSEWFSLLSGDDILKPEFVGEVKGAVNKNKDAVLVRTDWEVIDTQSRIISTNVQLSVSKVTTPPKTWMEQLAGPKTSFAAFAAKYAVWKNENGFPTDFHLCQDWIFWLKLAPHGNFIRIPKILAQYRSAERSELNIKRSFLRIEDEYNYFFNTLLKLPWNKVGFQFSQEKTIKSVRKKRFLDLLDYLIQFPEIRNNASSILLLQKISDSINDRHFVKWMADPQYKVFDKFQVFKNRLRLFIKKSFNFLCK